MSDGDDNGPFEALLEYLRRTRGFNFGGYKRASLMRRVDRRMQAVGVNGYADYLDYLEVHPDEFPELFDAILINVTDFFRDPSSWDSLAEEAIPRILAAKLPGESVRVWCAGCAGGAEAYTLAIVLAEALGIEAFRDRVKVYATDLDEGALASARQACYEPREVQGVPAALLEKYFDRLGHRYVFNKELRRAVIFGRHDLMQDAPISRVDLLTCRNTLMYFNGEAQARILERFHFALNDPGFLFLGKAETLLSYNHMFTAIDIKRRIFAKVHRARVRRTVAGLPQRAGEPAAPAQPAGRAHIGDAAFEHSPFPQLAVDALGLLVQANLTARRLLGISLTDVGRPFQDLQVSYRPADLRTCIDRAYAERRPVVLAGVEWPNGAGGPRFFDIQIIPLNEPGDAPAGVTIALNDASDAHRLKAAMEKSSRALEEVQEELQSASEELETTNEELQSANEELETTNEELQSANEELETTNEELQSTNEELEAVNEELRQRSDELNDVNFFLESILASLTSGVVVVDSEFSVRAWNPGAEDLWGLRAEEVRGKGLMRLDIGLPVEQLRVSIQASLDGRSVRREMVVDATNRRGRKIRCKVVCTPMYNGGGLRGAVLVMEELKNLLDGEREGPGDVATGAETDGSR